LLTHGPRAGDPRWSPDGRRIAFQTSSGRAGWSSQPSGPGGRLEIHVVNVDGSDQRRLAQDAAGTAWSPDGRRIASTRCCRGILQRGRGFLPDVVVMNADGSTKRRLSFDRSSSFHSWSPDGRRILYVSSRGNNEIYVVNPDGSGRRNLTRNPTFDGQPAWSPDGRRIAFASKRDGEWGIYVMNADGSGQQKLAAPRG
jgi:TolB protein